MAIIWQKSVAASTYQVRSAGRTRRLYTNGILHSEYNPGKVLTGSVWDLLLLGAFMVPKGKLHRVLMLGVGGGAAIHQILKFFPETKITGIELNPTHCEIAERFFELASPRFELINADALDWLEQYQGPKFDLIIDDLFLDGGGEPERSTVANRNWIKYMARRLNQHGTIVINHIDRDMLLKSAMIFETINSFRCGFRLTTGNCFNIVAAYCRQDIDSAKLRSRLQEYPLLDRRRKSCRLQYNIRPLF